jgi:hypothetical protein
MQGGNDGVYVVLGTWRFGRFFVMRADTMPPQDAFDCPMW